jgi:murein DD-endopeptidase MepM/ murein hydrolase activator NlpD
MAFFGIYLIKVSACMAAFYILYRLVFSKNTFFMLNRAYLLAGLIGSFVIPVLKLSLPESDYSVGLNDPLETTFDSLGNGLPVNSTVIDESYTMLYPTILMVIYFSGMAVVVLRLLFSVVHIIRLKKDAENLLLGNVKVLKAPGSHAFSFFTWIFIPNHKTSPLIIEHEKVHVVQYHWIDLILVEIASIILWFNPVMIFYKRSVKIQHEFLADASTIKNNTSVGEYLTCILEEIQLENSLAPTSPFYQSNTIKKRIRMITKNKTSVSASLVYLLSLPVVCLLLFSFATKPVPSFEVDDIVTENFAGDINLNLAENRPSIAPVEMSKAEISSGFGDRRNPLTKEKQFHTGMDFKLAEGEHVVATADGVITESAFDKGHGNYIIIKHDDTYATKYSHLKSALAKTGDQVKKGDLIGYVGNTGLSVGPHLHYEVSKDGKTVDPKDYLPNAVDK